MVHGLLLDEIHRAWRSLYLALELLFLLAEEVGGGLKPAVSVGGLVKLHAQVIVIHLELLHVHLHLEQRRTHLVGFVAVLLLEALCRVDVLPVLCVHPDQVHVQDSFFVLSNGLHLIGFESIRISSSRVGIH